MWQIGCQVVFEVGEKVTYESDSHCPKPQLKQLAMRFVTKQRVLMMFAICYFLMALRVISLIDAYTFITLHTNLNNCSYGFKCYTQRCNDE